jgi:hypothetical protein
MWAAPAPAPRRGAPRTGPRPRPRANVRRRWRPGPRAGPAAAGGGGACGGRLGFSDGWGAERGGGQGEAWLPAQAPAPARPLLPAAGQRPRRRATREGPPRSMAGQTQAPTSGRGRRDPWGRPLARTPAGAAERGAHEDAIQLPGRRRARWRGRGRAAAAAAAAGRAAGGTVTVRFFPPPSWPPHLPAPCHHTRCLAFASPRPRCTQVHEALKQTPVMKAS